MKKLLIAFLLSLSCGFTAAAVGCAVSVESLSSSENSSSSSSGSDSSSAARPAGTLEVDFSEGEGYTFVSDIADGDKVNPGDMITFSVDMSVFYTGYPVVSVNGKAVAPNDEGVYNVEINEAVEITVGGIQKAVSNMSGSGSFDDAYVVTSAVDLVYIAEQVNKGVYSYVTGAYVLANNIDCGGEELKVIGDLSTESSYFSGCFSCVTDSETGEMQRYTISNFVINSTDVNYVGLFGAVYSDLSVTSSGLFYGIRLDNFTVNASISEDAALDSRSISCGGLIGYGVGANVYLCDATNGTLNVYADDSYFAFAGGLIGYQQAYYSAEYSTHFPSEIVYSTADVDVKVLRGMALYAGGISGYLATNYPFGSTAFIHNSYATGSVSGALRSGGIAGGLGQYTSVSNCYATGNIVARATQSKEDNLMSSEEYCYANAGGLIGFAENDTIVNDCFFNGTVYAKAVSAGCANADPYVGGGYDDGYALASARKYVVENCVEKIDVSDASSYTKQLGWGDYDWLFTKNAYPSIYYGTVDSTVSAQMKINYVAPTDNGSTSVKVNGADSTTTKFFDTSTQSSNVYSPIGNYFLNGLDMYLEADNGYLSYGYYFDEACTKKVPYSYVPQKSIELYVGFADPTPVVGTYYAIYENNTDSIKLVFSKEGIVTYTDGATEQQANFLFDGTTLIVEGARLARYFNGGISVDEDAAEDSTTVVDAYFDMYRYSYYDFSGSVKNGELRLYDGVYFTKDAPLVAKTELFRGEYYLENGATYKFYGDKAVMENGTAYAEYDGYTVSGSEITLTDSTGAHASVTLSLADLKEFDQFKGVWTKSATVNKVYTFDGKEKWTYSYISYIRNGYSYEEKTVEQAEGTYAVENGVLTMKQGNTVFGTASFDSDGFLQVKNGSKTQTYYADGSYVGTWTVDNVTISLFGIQADGTGKATVDYGDEMVYNLVYELSETQDYVCLYWPHDDYWKDTVFGYFTYDKASNTLLSTITDPNSLTTGYMQTNMFVVDDYNGEWICNVDTFLNVEFDFNGYGLYGFLYGYPGMEGSLTLTENGVSTAITYTLDSTLEGKFAYNGVVYSMKYDEDEKAVVLTASGVTAELERKDILANVEFIDLNGNTYVFDGRSNLTGGGKVKINGTAEYGYVKDGKGWKLFNGTTEVGSLNRTDNCYTFTLNGNAEKLYISNEFMGVWALNGEYAQFELGPTDLNGVIQANYKGHDVELEYLDTGLLTFRYKEDKMPMTYYVFVVYDEKLDSNLLVLSQYTNLYGGEYTICTKANELYGAWTYKTELGEEWTIVFDGVTSGNYSNGQAKISIGPKYVTEYYYTIRETGIMMWSQAQLGGRTWYFKVDMLDISDSDALSGENVYVRKDADGNVIAAFRFAEVDGLYLTEATLKNADNTKTTYFFDGEGNLLVNGEIAYTYVIKAYNSDNTASLELTDPDTNVRYSATLDYNDRDNIILTIDNAIEE